jgi:hypothetical protein
LESGQWQETSGQGIFDLLLAATDCRSLATVPAGDCPCPNHAPKSRPWQTGQEEILLPVGKIGKGRAVPALCYGTARKPGKKLKMRCGWSGALLLGLAKTELSLQFDTNSRLLANLDSIVEKSCDAFS